MAHEQLREDGLDGARGDQVRPMNGERHARELVDHCEHLQRADRGDGVVGDVEGPNVT